MLWPWIGDTAKKYGNIELLSANFGHALALHIPGDMWLWELKNGIMGEVPIRFFPEYSHPETAFPEEFFFVTQGHYSLHSQKHDKYLNGEDKYPPAIKHNDKIAILMKEPLFGGFLEAFKDLQKNPLDNSLLNSVISEIKKIGDMPDNVIVVCPIDPEVSYTGSKFGGVRVWEIVLEAIIQENLGSVFVKISDWLDFFRENAGVSRLPRKDLSKWVNLPQQIKWSDSLLNINGCLTDKQKTLLSLATSSDILAGWWFEDNPDARVIEAKDEKGGDCVIQITGNQEVIRASIAAAYALNNGDSFLSLIGEINSDSLFIRRLKKIAEDLKL